MTNASPTAESARQWLRGLAVSLWVRVPDEDAAWHVAEGWSRQVEDEVMDGLVASAEPAIVPVPDEMVGAERVEPYPVPSVTRILHRCSASGSLITRTITREHSIAMEARRMRDPVAGGVFWHLSAALHVDLTFAVEPLPSDPGEQIDGGQVRLGCSLRGLSRDARESLSAVAARFADGQHLMYGQVGKPLNPGASTVLEDHLPWRGGHAKLGVARCSAATTGSRW